MSALKKLRAAQERTGSMVSVGLEPCPEYQHPKFRANLEGYEDYLRTIIEATEGLVCAYKINVAFFEALGWEGTELLYCVREMIPDDVLLIADAKRGDIGTTAERYAVALYDKLEADAVTLNPLMGKDSAEPFLARTDKLNFFLALTSNPGAADFFLYEGLYRRICEKVCEWNTSKNCGIVVGATQADRIREVRTIAVNLPILIPGIGAQGGDLEKTLKYGLTKLEPASLIIHATRGILPNPEDPGDPADNIRKLTTELRDRIKAAQGAVK